MIESLSNSKLILKRNVSLQSLLLVSLYFIGSLLLSNDLWDICASTIMSIALFLGLVCIYDAEKGFFCIRNLFFILLFCAGYYFRFLYVHFDQDFFGIFLVERLLVSSGVDHFKTSIVFLIFSLLYIVGLYFPQRNREQISTQILKFNTFSGVLIAIYIFLLVFYFVYRFNNLRVAVSADFGIHDNLFNILGTFEKFIAYINLIIFFETKKKKYAFFAAIFLIPYIMLSVMSLYKGTLVFEILTLLVIKRKYQVNKIPFRYFVVLIIAFLVIYPTISMLRSNQTRKDNQTEINVDSVNEFYKDHNPLIYVSNRFSYYDETYYVVTRDADFLKHFRSESGNFIVNLFASFVPRVLWNDKPVVSVGSAVTYKLCLLPKYIYTNLSVGVIGESIALGGFALFMLVSFFMGLIQGKIDRLIQYDNSWFAFAFHIMVGRTLIGLSEGNIISTIISLVSIFVFRNIIEYLAQMKLKA